MGRKQINTSNMQLKYDERADVLYASLGDPQKAVAKEISSGDFIRYNPFTDEVVGVTILDFEERFMIHYHKKNIQPAKDIIIQLLKNI